MAGALTALLIAAVWLSTSLGAAEAVVTLFVSGDTRGYLEPCGCRRDQAGGLPGRMTLVKQNQAPDRLLVDVGNLTTGGRSYELLKLRYLLTGMSRMGYDAVNLGRREAGLDRDTLANIIAESRAPFVSCNVLDKSRGTPLAEPYRIKTVAGLRIGITGVTEAEEDEAGPGVQVRPAVEALADLLPRLRSQCDYIVVLAYLAPERLRALADRFHEIHCLLGGDVPQSSERADTINRAVAFNVTDRGKVLGKLTFRRAGRGLALIDSTAFKVKDTLPPAPEMTALLTEYRNALRERSVEFASEEGLEPIASVQTTADTYAGQEACRSCHPQAHQVTLASLHAHAFETLVKKKAEYDPECLRCHAVGYGAQDGYRNRETTPQFINVQCENCHGRGGPHQSKDFAAGGYEKVCLGCHTEKHSLNFVFAERLPLVSHAANAQFASLSADERVALLARRDKRERTLFQKGRFVGSESCKSCHAQQHQIWSESAHAKAFETLRAQHVEKNTDCVRCHVTGFGEEGGYPGGGPAMAGVGCESCHGPGGDHVTEGARRQGTILALTDKCDSCVILQICGSCHDGKWDPDLEWNLEAKLAKIRHGMAEAASAP
jgi:hypothetical protein